MMIEKISEHIARAIAVTEDEKNGNILVYKYGLQIIISTLIDIIIALCLGVLSNNKTEIILFLLIYCSIRVYVGGFHASNSRNCMLFFLIGIIIMIFIPEYDFSTPCIFGVILIENLLVFLFAPVTAINNPLEKKQKEKMKLKAIKINIFWSLFLFLLRFLNFETSIFGIYAFIWIILVLLAGQIKIVIFREGKHDS